MKKIPLLDIKAEYIEIKDTVDEAIQRVVTSARFILGDEVENFEREFADFSQAGYAIGVGSGTDALYLALKACGIGAGDEVITTPMTFIATAEAISLCGAVPVFADVDALSHNISPDCLESVLTPRTRAIIPVHIHGQPADMDPILEFARRNNLFVIEDAAQAHGAEYKGRRIGTLGDLSCFSFYPGKNLGAYGDAGMITTNNSELAGNLKLLRDHGRTSKYEHKLLSFNWRLDALQAAILRAKLPNLEAWNLRRREIAALYDHLLESAPIQKPLISDDIKTVWHHYAINIENRDGVAEKLKAEGIETGIHYPLPLHLQPAYQFLGYKKGDFPSAEKIANTTLSLPIYPSLTNDQVNFVVETLIDVLSNVP